MCEEDVDDSLSALKIVSDWFVLSKMIQKLFAALYEDENLTHSNEDSVNLVFICNRMGILNIDINNINLYNKFMKIMLILLFLSDFWSDILNLENKK